MSRYRPKDHPAPKSQRMAYLKVPNEDGPCISELLYKEKPMFKVLRETSLFGART